MVAILLSVFALIQRQTADQERENAEFERFQSSHRLLAGQAETELTNGFHDRAVLLAMAALEEFPYTSQAEHALGQAVTYNRSLVVYQGHTSAVTGATGLLMANASPPSATITACISGMQ